MKLRLIVLNLIPIFLLGVFGLFSIRNFTSTVISLICLIIIPPIIYGQIRKETKTFHFSFTLSATIGAHLVYELIGMHFMRITHFEYVINISLLTLTFYMIYRTKIAKDYSIDFGQNDLLRDINALSDESRRIAMAQEQIPYYNYCRRCQAIIPGRDHHCVWLNVCIGKSNIYWFLGSVTIGACWIGLMANIFLGSICHPISIYSPKLLRGNTAIAWIQDYGLVPVSCPEAYKKPLVTMCYVTSVYGLVVQLLLVSVLIHQLRLLFKGVTSLELKHGGANMQPRNAAFGDIPQDYDSDSSQG